MLTVLSWASDLTEDLSVESKTHFKNWLESREVGTVLRGESQLEDFSLSIALWMYISGSCKGSCGKVMLRSMCILVDGFWVQVVKWKKDLIIKDIIAHEGNVLRSSLDFHFPFMIHSLWREVLGGQQDTMILVAQTPWLCCMISGPNSSYIHLVHK